MPLPIIGALAGGLIKKAAGKALRWATRGRLIGSGGGTAIARRVGGAIGAATTVGTGVAIARQVRRPTMPSEVPWEGGQDYPLGRPPRRKMNPMNVRALRRAVRRVGSAEKLFRQVFTISGGKVTPRTKRR